MEYLLMLLAFPLIWPFVAKKYFDRQITVTSSHYTRRYRPAVYGWGQVAANFLIVAAAVTIVWVAGSMSQFTDTEIWNGQVASKSKDRVPCRHSYSCNCRESCSGSGKDRSCSTTCDTCYEHSYDIDWNVQTTISTFDIDKIDRQGLKEPPRWTIVKPGDPVSHPHSYQNYIKGSPDSLFNKMEYIHNKYINLTPEYPAGQRDYHYVDRLVSFGGSFKEDAAWNQQIALALRELGQSKQVNIVVVAAANDKSIADALKYKWLGGKKNDVVVVIGVKDYPKPEWVEVISWSTKNQFHADLRDAIMNAGDLTPVGTVNIIASEIKRGFYRMHMKDYEYLKDQTFPPNWVIILAVCLSVFGSIGVSFVIRKINHY